MTLTVLEYYTNYILSQKLDLNRNLDIINIIEYRIHERQIQDAFISFSNEEKFGGLDKHRIPTCPSL